MLLFLLHLRCPSLGQKPYEFKSKCPSLGLEILLSFVAITVLSFEEDTGEYPIYLAFNGV